MMFNLVNLPGFKRNFKLGEVGKSNLHYFYAAGTRVRLDSPYPSLWHKHALTHALRFLQIPGVKSVDNAF